MTTPDRPPVPPATSRFRQLVSEFVAIDEAVSVAVAATPSPLLDTVLGRVSNAANRSALWIATAGAISLVGPRPRRAALTGLAAIAVTSATVNLGVKPLLARKRPDRDDGLEHRVLMPSSHAFPSGHSASAFAFSTAVGGDLPGLATPLRLMASAVAYSRVQTGVHYVGDVVVGALAGAAVGTITRQVAARIPQTVGRGEDGRWRTRD
jgi:undecaprenyl-diphosphatase